MRSERNHSEPSGRHRGSVTDSLGPARDDRLLTGGEVADDQLGGVPRHRRVVPLQPRQRAAVRGQPRCRDEVRAGDQHLRLARGVGVEDDDLVDDVRGPLAVMPLPDADDPGAVRAEVAVGVAVAAWPARLGGEREGSPPGSSRYRRWSAQSVNHTTPSCTHQPAPPYSWTAVRALRPSGSSSSVPPSARRRTSCVRPPSAGRPSAHTTSMSPSCGPSTRTSPRRTAAATTTSDVTGVAQAPKGRSTVRSGSGIGSITTGATLTVISRAGA